MRDSNCHATLLKYKGNSKVSSLATTREIPWTQSELRPVLFLSRLKVFFNWIALLSDNPFQRGGLYRKRATTPASCHAALSCFRTTGLLHLNKRFSATLLRTGAIFNSRRTWQPSWIFVSEIMLQWAREHCQNRLN